MVLDVKDFNLKEDEIRGHGLLVTAKDFGLCAPSGECLQQHVYATTMQNWKMLQIEANPVLTRDTFTELHAIQNGKHAPPNGIDANSGTVWFEIFSIVPKKDH